MLEIEQRRLLADRYELTELIGAGGAARVYKATDRQLGRDVAVKLLDDAAAKSADPAARQRFLHEARTTAAFDHPNIVTVYDAGTDGDALFLVMELVSGQTLAEHIARSAPLPVEEATGLARQIADALAAAHRLGVVHRDIKPANVLLDHSGRVRLTDFGIAKQLDEIEAAITTEGMVVGTPTYIAPEQAMGRELSPATDVYALGLVLHEMLTGSHPPRGDGAATAWRMAPFDPRTHCPGVPESVAAAVLRATDPDPTERFPSAAEMLAALGGPVLDDDPTPAPDPASVLVATPTATMHAAAPAAGVAAAAADGRTALLPPLPGEPTAALAEVATEPGPTRSPWPLLVLVLVALIVAAAVVAADRGARSTSVTTPTATTVAAPPTTVAAPVTTVVPVVVAPAEGGGNGDEGGGNGNQGDRGKPDKDDEKDDD
jgi:hypothetical protein